MKILVLPRRREGIALETMQPHFVAEIQKIWDLYVQGVVREIYTRADQPGAAILAVEAPNVEDARKALAKLPLVEMNMLDLDFIPLAPFTNLSRLFQAQTETSGRG